MEVRTLIFGKSRGGQAKWWNRCPDELAKGNRPPLPLPGVLKFRTNILRIRRICESGSLRTPNMILCAYIQLGSTSSRLRACWIVTRTCPRTCRLQLTPPANPALSRHIQLYMLWHSYLMFSTSQKTLTKDWRFNNAWMMFQWQVWVTFKLSHTRSHQNEKKCHIFCRPAKRKITLARGKRTWKNCLNNVNILVLAWVWPAKRKRTLARGKRTWKNWLAVDLDLKLWSTMMVCWHVTRLSDSFGLSADSRTSDPLGETFTIWFANISRTFLRLWPFCDSWLL